MIDAGLSSELLRRTLSRGGEYADVYHERRLQTFLAIEDGRIEKVVTGGEEGVGVRLIAGGRTAYAYSNDLSRDTLMRCAGESSKAARSGETTLVADLSPRRPAFDFPIRLAPSDVPPERKISLVRTADAAARSVDKRIRQVVVLYRDTVQKVGIASSEGYLAEDDRVYTTFIVQVIASDGGVIQTSHESVGGFSGFELFEEFPVDELARKAARRAVMMLTARKAPAGRMTVVISSRAGGTMIHEAIGHGLEADLSRQGLSVFAGKIGLQVASPLVTVVDDATLPGKRGSFRFDDEGTPSQRTVLVEKGILRQYLYDRLTALRHGAAPTGNGRRESYRHRPIPRMTNTFIAEGDTPPDEILGATEKGLFVVKMGGGQVNTVTGEFVFDVQEGYLIEKGGIGAPVRGATLTGNGPDVLQSIDMVGHDLGFSIGTCGKDSQGVPVTDAMPTVRIPEMVVGGSHGP